MPRLPAQTRRRLFAAASTATLALAGSGALPGRVRAAGNLPPELLLAGAPDDYIGYGFIPRYFPQTGHNVGGAFLRFFVAAGGVDVLGLPLSEEVPRDGHTVQWFQDARLEWWPENPPAEQVQYGLVGQEHLKLAAKFVPASA